MRVIIIHSRGILVAINYNIVRNCIHKEYTSSKALPGIVGRNEENGVIEKCFNYCNSSSLGYRQGIVYSNSGIVKDCANFGNLIGGEPYTSSGICHTNKNTGVILNCYNEGDLYARYHNSSGIACVNEGLIIGCYNKGNLSGAGDSRIGGGITEKNAGTIISSYSISNSYIVKQNSGTIIGSYDKSSKSALVSSNTGTITNSYYYDNTNSIMCDAEGNAITINEGETEQTALKRLLQAANDALSNDEDYETKKVTWKIDANINSGYPSFIWQNKSE